jgi:hypothetical protein
MGEEIQELVKHDGAYLPAKILIEMAKKAGSYNVAEHYIVSLLNYAIIYNKPHIREYVDEITKHYNLDPLPTAKTPASNNNMPNFENPHRKQAENARIIYCKMGKEQRESILKEALAKLRIEKEELFMNGYCWIGIYLVVRDRLDEDLKMTTFCGYSITPSGWPSKLALGTNSLSNFGRYIKGKDKLVSYYFMKDNPFKALCDKFWEILFSLILTKKQA